ncbi:hypothetical protein BVY02_01035, partial [bacterium J17]
FDYGNGGPKFKDPSPARSTSEVIVNNVARNNYSSRADAPRPRRSRRSSYELEDDLPNETWRTPPKWRSAARGSQIETEASSEERSTIKLESHLEEALENTADTLAPGMSSSPNRVSQPAARRSSRDAKPERTTERKTASATQQKANLSKRLKEMASKELGDEETSSDPIYQQTAIVDPVAFKIAKRLLNSGKEIHVVARKLDLPVSEVRLLDSLLRQESKLADAEIVEEPVVEEPVVEETTYEEKAQGLAKQITKSVETPTKKTATKKLLSSKMDEMGNFQQDIYSELRERELDIEIEREVALL